MRIATGAMRPRNDRVSMECGTWQAGDREGRPYGGLQGVPCGRADRGVRPYGWGIDGAVCGGTHGSRPTGHFCRAGPACPAGGAGKTRSGRCRHRPLRKRYKRRRKTGRCGERTERCRWQKKRSERVAAVKILSVRRKAAQKFWAPQQDHRPLRRVTRSALRAGGQGRPPLRVGY